MHAGRQRVKGEGEGGISSLSSHGGASSLVCSILSLVSLVDSEPAP